jgi:hypothetical protein
VYATAPMTKEEIAKCTIRSPHAGFLGHTVTGYEETGQLVIETDSEIQASLTPTVVFIRRRMNGKYIWRRITERP